MPTIPTARSVARSRVLNIALLLGAPAALAVGCLVPKDMSFAAPSRFLLVCGVSAGAVACAAGSLIFRQRHRERVRLRKYGPASSAVRDTLSYLQQEERLARRGWTSATIAGLGLAALSILGAWPQSGWLNGHQSQIAWAAALSLGIAAVSLARRRGHLANAFFLRRYVRQQVRHIGYPVPRFRAWLRERKIRRQPPVTVTGPGSFAIGGFAFQTTDFLTNCLVTGQVGSGKTVCVLNSLLEGLIASNRGAPAIGGLVLDAKGDYRDKIERLCARYGRLDDLFILDPATWADAAGTWRSIAWNPLHNDDDALEVATRLIAALRLIGLEQGNTGSFWLDSAGMFIRHAIVLIRAARQTPAPSIVDVHRLAQEGEGATPLYHALIRAIGERFAGAGSPEIMDAIAYMEREWAGMAPNQKSGIVSSITQLLNQFLVPPFDEIFTRPTTLPIPDAIDQGKILYIHMPVSDRERMSRLVNTLVKLEYQRHILLRRGKERPSFFVCDEFQTFYTSGEGRGDSDFLERSRESRHANILATQNISAFYKRVRNRDDVQNFFGHCAIKVFLRNSGETNRWASDLFGQRSEIVVTTNEQAAFAGSGSRRRMTSYGRATQNLPAVPPETFTALGIPIRGSADHRHAESVIHLGSRAETIRLCLSWPVNPLR